MGDSLPFLVIDNQNLFIDKRYKQISYRLVLLHALQYYYLKPKESRPFESLLKDLREVYISTTTAGFYEPQFVELYPFFQKEHERGLLLIDRSKGCYPLVLYPNDSDPEHGNRIISFVGVIDDLLRNHQFFENYLREHTVWNEDVVEILKSKFTFSE